MIAGIAGIALSCTGLDEGFEAWFDLKKFTVSDGVVPELTISLNGPDMPGFSEHYGIAWLNDDYRICFSKRNRSSFAVVRRDLQEVWMASQPVDQAAVSGLFLESLYTCLLGYGVLMAHASLVDVEGDGVLFIGPSGAGKTTQAELWSRHLGAVIINGDHVILRGNSGFFDACGSPWHGSSVYCENRLVRLRAVVALEKAPFNRIRRLDSLASLVKVQENFYLPGWQTDRMEKALETLDALLQKVPVFLLQNRADRETVMLTRDTVLEGAVSRIS